MRNFVSIKNIIDSLYRDLGLETEPNWLDWIEWAATALEYIDARWQYVIRTTDNCDKDYLEVSCHKAELPDDFHALIEPVIMNGRVLIPNHNSKLYASYVTSNEVTDRANNIPITDNIAPRIVNNVENINGVDYYTIIDNCLYTTIAEGTIVLSYYAIPVDDDGYPMIPDEFFYKEAVKSYITYRMLYIRFLAGSITDRVYLDAKNKWIYAAQAAINAAKTPTVGEMESIKRQWVRLFPDMNAYDKGLRTIGLQFNKRLK